MEYKIDCKGFSYNPYEDEIGIGISQKSFKKLTDDELIEFISDSITHEHIHRVIYLNINITVNCLFDIIGDNFENKKIAEKALEPSEFFWSSRDYKFVINYYLNLGFIDRITLRNELKNWDL